MINVAARGVNDKNYDTVEQSQSLQPQFVVSVALVFTGNGEALKHRVAAYEVKAMLIDIGFTFYFIKADHYQIVDAI